MDKIFRLTKVTKFSDGDENFVQRKILSDIVLSDKVELKIKKKATQRMIERQLMLVPINDDSCWFRYVSHCPCTHQNQISLLF